MTACCVPVDGQPPDRDVPGVLVGAVRVVEVETRGQAAGAVDGDVSSTMSCGPPAANEKYMAWSLTSPVPVSTAQERDVAQRDVVRRGGPA